MKDFIFYNTYRFLEFIQKSKVAYGTTQRIKLFIMKHLDL